MKLYTNLTPYLQIIEIEGNDVSKSGFDPKKVAVDVVKQLEKIVGK